MKATSSVQGQFKALHADRFNPTDVHEHVWQVEVSWPSEHVADARYRERQLQELLSELEGTRLPDRLSWAESLAVHFMDRCCARSARVSRADIGYSATAERSVSEYRQERRRWERMGWL